MKAHWFSGNRWICLEYSMQSWASCNLTAQGSRLSYLKVYWWLCPGVLAMVPFDCLALPQVMVWKLGVVVPCWGVPAIHSVYATDKFCFCPLFSECWIFTDFLSRAEFSLHPYMQNTSKYNFIFICSYDRYDRQLWPVTLVGGKTTGLLSMKRRLDNYKADVLEFPFFPSPSPSLPLPLLIAFSIITLIAKLLSLLITFTFCANF